MAPRPAIFLDRDGTLNVEVDYLSDPADVRLEAGVPDALCRLAAAGYALVVVTNQSGIARGRLDEATLARVHNALATALAAEDASIDGWYHCPHHPTVGEAPYRTECSCRKPAPGMLERAARELDLDLGRSWIVGDSVRDLAAGAALGVPGVLVRTGKGRAQEPRIGEVDGPRPVVVDDLGEAAAHVLAHPRERHDPERDTGQDPERAPRRSYGR